MVELIRKNKKPISIGVGKFCFPIEDGVVQENEAQLAGCKAIDYGIVPGDRSFNHQELYLKSYELAKKSHSLNSYDRVTDNEFT